MLLALAIGAGTRKTYAVGVSSFVDFTQRHGIAQVLPASPATLCLWLASLACPPRSLAIGTCKLYLAALVTHHIECGFDSPLRDSPPMVDRLMAGIKRHAAASAKKPKLPITTSLLRLMQPHLQLATFGDSLLWAVFWVATTGMLRISEFTIANNPELDRPLRRTQLTAFDSANRLLDLGSSSTVSNPALISRLSLHLDASKTDPWRGGVDIVLATRTTINAMCAYLLLRSQVATPEAASSPFLFALASGAPITRTWLMPRVTLLLRLLHLDPLRYSSHSFRKGGAVSLQAAGAPDSLVRQQGRWKSDAFLGYLRDPQLSTLVGLTANL
jgi:hypothetical protein